jgi:hypothetical protein
MFASAIARVKLGMTCVLTFVVLSTDGGELMAGLCFTLLNAVQQDTFQLRHGSDDNLELQLTRMPCGESKYCPVEFPALSDSQFD